jgi:anaerobic selenocysteine-containing dehydrogenase
MTYKRQIDRLPIIPKDAKEFNVTCHYCIVGCGYKAYAWAVNKQGGTAPDENKFGIDLGKQQPAETAAWYAPAMYNIVQQNGEDVHIVIKPDKECVVNSGLGSVRGARMAEMSYSQARNTQLQRLTDPMVWRYGQMQPTSWDDALDLVARVTIAVIDAQGEDGLFVSAFDHGGAGGGYENTWPYLINNGRTNIVWQSAYLDQENEFVMDRMPFPLIQMNPAGHGRYSIERWRSGRDLQRQRIDTGDGLSDRDGAAKGNVHATACWTSAGIAMSSPA